MYQIDYANSNIRFEVYGKKVSSGSLRPYLRQCGRTADGCQLMGSLWASVLYSTYRYMTEDRYDHALLDLTQQCPGGTALFKYR